MADDDKQDFAYEEEQDFEESSSSEPQEEDEAEYEDAEDQEDDPDEVPGDDEEQDDLSEDPQEDEDEDQDDEEQEPEDEEQGEEADLKEDARRTALTPEDLDNTSAVTRALNRAGHDPSRLYERSEDMPDAIKRKLEALDKESAKQKDQEEGTGTAPGTDDDGGSRFFGLAQTAIARSKSRMSRSAELFKKNFKIFLIIIIAFAGYYVYLNYIGQPVIQSFSDLKEATPLKLDDYTTLNKVEEDGPWIVMEIIKDEAYYQGQSIAQREESLDRIEANAQSLCSNSILGSMIRNGHKITVLLKGSAGSFTRNFTVEQCPGTENDQSH